MLSLETKTVSHGQLTFSICQGRVYLQNSVQAFLLEPTEYYYRKRLIRIALTIELGHIRSYNDLFEHFYTKENAAMIRLVPVKRGWMK